ncbi:hypothetical protein NDU88_005954 [Pleurodeles waltl]|uniref:Uncharacterized protein n=1 Tax=Pleurodeles waltl TaxID=8319 RepID=A0AAV7VLF7_PLEWA|nr:hypothetical protein NDU88_005954 [Pleurodeles waltl]
MASYSTEIGWSDQKQCLQPPPPPCDVEILVSGLPLCCPTVNRSDTQPRPAGARIPRNRLLSHPRRPRHPGNRLASAPLASWRPPDSASWKTSSASTSVSSVSWRQIHFRIPRLGNRSEPHSASDSNALSLLLRLSPGP